MGVRTVLLASILIWFMFGYDVCVLVTVDLLTRALKLPPLVLVCRVSYYTCARESVDFVVIGAHI